MAEGFTQCPHLLDLACRRFGSLLDVLWGSLASGPLDPAGGQSARRGKGAIIFGWLLERDTKEEIDETDEEEEPGCGEGKAFGIVGEKIGADLTHIRRSQLY